MATTCDNKDLFESIEHCPGSVNLPGIYDLVFVMPIRHIVKWPTTPDAASAMTAKEMVAYKDEFTLAPEAKWKSIRVNREKSHLTFNNQGEKGSKTFANKAEITMYGTSEDARAFATMVNNEPMVILARDAADKRYSVLGCELYGGAEVNTSGDTGAKATDANETKLEVIAEDIMALPYYNGKITTENGDISGETGEPVEAA